MSRLAGRRSGISACYAGRGCSARSYFSLRCGQPLHCTQLYFSLRVRAAAALHAVLLQLAVRAAAALHAAVLQLAVRAAAALHAVLLQLAVRAGLQCSCTSACHAGSRCSARSCTSACGGQPLQCTQLLFSLPCCRGCSAPVLLQLRLGSCCRHVVLLQLAVRAGLAVHAVGLQLAVAGTGFAPSLALGSPRPPRARHDCARSKSRGFSSARFVRSENEISFYEISDLAT